MHHNNEVSWPWSDPEIALNSYHSLCSTHKACCVDLDHNQGGITCGAIDEPRKSSKAIDKRVIIDFRDKNVVIARFCDKNVKGWEYHP